MEGFVIRSDLKMDARLLVEVSFNEVHSNFIDIVS